MHQSLQPRSTGKSERFLQTIYMELAYAIAFPNSEER